MTTRSASYRAQILSRLERFVWPLIGTKPLGSVRPVDVLRVIEPLPLRGVVQVPPARHYRHLREAELGAFWCAVEKQGARFVTIAAAKLLPYSMCRKSEVLRVPSGLSSTWSEPSGRFRPCA